MLKLDVDGNVIWDRSYGGSDFDGIFGFEELPDGGFIIGGASRSGISGSKTSAGHGGMDFWLLRTDAAGTVIWDRTFGGDDREFWARGSN